LGSSGLEVSVLSLGSWRTYERLPRDDALAVMVAAREAGITFLDDARYDDETGTAPIPTGWSEVLFGELFRAAGWARDEVVVANKLWWEFWPGQPAAEELDGSLGRMQMDHVDLIYAMTLPDGLDVARAVEEVTGLVAGGRARAWAVANWPPDQIAQALEVARAAGVAGPCAAQLPYSLVRRTWVEDPAMEAVLADGEIGLVASYALAGGTLTGKYLRGESGRASGSSDALSEAGRRAAGDLAALAQEWDVEAAQLALAFALDHPRLASLLFGATSPAQLATNLGALDVHRSLSDGQRARLRQVGA
jgi:aryl-alcohol dehydrogenase-like predicted oxidoreductase